MSDSEKPQCPSGVHSLVWKRLDGLEEGMTLVYEEQRKLNKRVSRIEGGAAPAGGDIEDLRMVVSSLVEDAERRVMGRIEELRAQLDEMTANGRARLSAPTAWEPDAPMSDGLRDMQLAAQASVPPPAAPGQPKGKRQL